MSSPLIRRLCARPCRLPTCGSDPELGRSAPIAASMVFPHRADIFLPPLGHSTPSGRGTHGSLTGASAGCWRLGRPLFFRKPTAPASRPRASLLRAAQRGSSLQTASAMNRWTACAGEVIPERVTRISKKGKSAVFTAEARPFPTQSVAVS
jgi:hypothetical protein